MTQEHSDNLDKEYSIGEISSILNIKEHTIRFWEGQFTSLSPTKSDSGRRKYKHNDLVLLQQIKYLLYEEGYTVKGAKKELENEQSRIRNTLMIERDDSETLFEEFNVQEKQNKLIIATSNKKAENPFRKRDLKKSKTIEKKINEQMFIELYTRINNLILFWEESEY